MTATLDYRLVHDPFPEDPRQWGPVSVVALFDNRRDLANEWGRGTEDFTGWADMRDTIERDGGVHIVPVWGLDHSGFTLAAGPVNPFRCPWDSAQVGYAWTTPERMTAAGVSGETVRAVIASEIADYGAYLEGDGCGWEIVDDTGQVFDSCMGYLSREDAEQAARETLHTITREDRPA